METRVAVISIILEDIEAAENINILLHQYRQYVIGRMGVPHAPKKISIISVAVDGDPRACYFKQVKNGRYIRMALMLKLLGID